MYTPREGQWSWFFHRISGAAIFFFLFGHIVSTSVVVWGHNGPAMHEALDRIYRLPIFTIVLHPLLFCAVLYHALNGIRVVIIDWWSQSSRAQRPLFYITAALFVIIFVAGGVFQMILPELRDYQKAKAGLLPNGTHVTHVVRVGEAR